MKVIPIEEVRMRFQSRYNAVMMADICTWDVMAHNQEWKRPHKFQYTVMVSQEYSELLGFHEQQARRRLYRILKQHRMTHILRPSETCSTG